MSKAKWVQLLVALVLLVGGIVGYFAVVPKSGVNVAALDRLLLNEPDLASIPNAPPATFPSPVNSASPSSVRQGNRLDPDQTGVFNADWLSPKAAAGVTSTVELLPTTALADLAYNELYAQWLAANVISSQQGTLKGRFTLPGIAKSAGVSFTVPNTNVTGTIPVTTGIIRIDRAVVLLNVEGPDGTKANLTSLMNREAVLLRKYVPTWPSMGNKTYSLGASLAWFGVLAALILLLFAVPASVRRTRAHRVARDEARRRYELRSRGAKVGQGRRARR